MALLAVTGSAAAAVELDATSTNTGASDLTTLSINHATPEGEDRLLAVTLAWDDLNDARINSIDYGGHALTCHGPARGTAVATDVCTLVTPPTGDHDLNVTWDSIVTEHAVVFRSFTGVHQTNAVGATATSTGSDTAANLAITTTRADALLVGGTVAETTGVSLSPRSGVAEDADLTAGSLSLGISHAAGRKPAPTTGSHDFGWNLSSSQNWATAVAEIHRTDHEVAFETGASSGEESSTSPSLGVAINESSNASISVDYAIVGGNATGGGDDYTLSDGTLTIDAGTTSGSIDLGVNDDSSDEPDETVEILLSNPSTGATVAEPSLHNYTIVDDDPNHAPNPASASVSTDEDTSHDGILSATDQDQNDTIAGFAIDDTADHGTVSLDTSTGDYTYTPDADFAGQDSFSFTATDNHGATSANATVSVTVNAVNDAPSASGDSGSTDEDTSVWIDVISNDSDVDGDSLSVSSATSPSDGATSVPGNGTVKYTPDADFNGGDSFEYTVSDGTATDTATVSITVNAVNDAPVASDDSGSTDEDTPVWVDVLSNDSDVDGDGLSVSSAASPRNGATSVPGNGTVKYTPDANWNGEDSFDYTITDGSLADTATVSITVNAVNDPPSASDDSTTTDEDTAVWVDVLANDSDVDGDGLSVSSTTGPSDGTTSIPGNGTVKYTPDADWNGEDSFDYTVSDGSVTDTATVNVTVNAVNDAPQASGDSANATANVTTWIAVLANDSDPDGDVLSVASATSPANGTTSVPGNGTVAYTADAGSSGFDTFTYTASDGSLTSTANVNVNVAPGGGPGGGAEVLSSSVRVLNGSLSGDPTVNTSAVGSSLNVQLENASGGIDLADLGATNDTVLEINLTMRNFTPTILMGRAQVVDWTNSTNENGTENVSFELEPISMAFIHDCTNYTSFMGYCGPSSPDEWPTDSSEDRADVSFEAALRVFLSDLSYLNETMADALRGGYVTTDAQAMGAMNVTGSDSAGGASLTIPVAGPHTLPDGTDNTGFFEARIPDALLSWWGIDDPNALTGEYQGANRTVTITNATNGTLFHMDIHYSSGNVSITEDTTAPTADAGSDRTVDVDASVTFDGSGSSDNQGITNYNWTFDDGSTGAGETTTHTYTSTGTYEVTLNVSDGAGNTDTDTVTVTVESTSSGGGGGGGGGSTADFSADTSVTAASLSATDVEPGENLTAKANVTNTGDAAGWHTVTFEAGNTTVGDHRVHVSVGETEVAEVTFSLDENGTYTVTADGVEAGNLTVGEPDEDEAPALELESAGLAGDDPAAQRDVNVTIGNPDDVERNATVALARNGTTVANVTVAVPANGSANATLEGLDEAGTYVVVLDGAELGNVTVARTDLAPPGGDEPADDGPDPGSDGMTGATGRDGDGRKYYPQAATPGPGFLAALACGLGAAVALRSRRT